MAKTRKPPKKSVIKGTIVRVRLYGLVSDEIENAIRSGYRRAHKHTNDPEDEAIVQEVHRYVMNSMNDLFLFPEED